MMTLPWLACVVSLAAGEPKTVTVTADDTVITESCTVVIAPGTVIADTNGDGVIHIKANDITVTFGSVGLRGAKEKTPWDQLTGCGIRVDGFKNVTLRGALVAGYKVGVRATHADGLNVEGGDLSDNYRQHLRSTPGAEDASDWLYPHKNDNHEWVTEHGAALCVENSSKVTVTGVRVRRGQNGIILDRVEDAKVYGNDCSFLSGWGLAMWRSNRNVVSRNAFDFCVRGYSHGVYNRGQDSAGILAFEQCNDNTFIENSVTHGGDGFFGFAGQEAIGEVESKTPGFDPVGKGNNNNLLIDNDFSYAAAHGIEMTFSYGNKFIRNRIVDNAICGVWAGYCQDTTIALNLFSRNGSVGSGGERGGVNIEHGSGNYIIENRFRNNSVGVHLWWDNDEALLGKPAIKAKDRGVTKNVIANNSFDGDTLALQLRDTGTGHLGDNVFSGNSMQKVEKEMDVPRGGEPRTSGDASSFAPPVADVLGKKKVFGARANQAGREYIVMTEWGPYEHLEPMVRLGVSPAGTNVYEMYKMPVGVRTELIGKGVQGVLKKSEKGLPATYTITATIPGVVPYSFDLTSKALALEYKGTIFNALWDATFFAWTDESDPRQDLKAWRSLADASGAVAVRVGSLDFPYNHGGPSDLKLSDELTKAAFKPDHFGMIATTSVKIPRGVWKVTTLSDDGVRVRVNGAAVIENWAWHAPTQDSGLFKMDADGVAEFVVEHFEIDGAAVLRVRVERAD